MTCPNCGAELVGEKVLDAVSFEEVAEQFLCPADRFFVQVPVEG